MASKYWIKLYIETLDDAKMGRLSDNLWRRFFECCLLAGELDEGGKLPPIQDIAWRLRIDETALQNEFDQMARYGLLDYRADEIFTGYWFVTKFAERQAPMTTTERVERFRKSQKRKHYQGVTQPVTNRYTDIEVDIDIDKREREKRPPTGRERYFAELEKRLERKDGN